MTIRQKVCPLCDGNGRWDDIECLLCDTRGYIELRDEDDAPALTSSSSGLGAYQGRPDAAARVGNGSAPDRAGPLLTSDDVEAAYIAGYSRAYTQRRTAQHAAEAAAGGFDDGQLAIPVDEPAEAAS